MTLMLNKLDFYYPQFSNRHTAAAAADDDDDDQEEENCGFQRASITVVASSFYGLSVCPSVRPSVRLSVKRVLCDKTK